MVVLGLALARLRRSCAVPTLDAQQRLQIRLLAVLLRAIQVLLTVRLLLTWKVVVLRLRLSHSLLLVSLLHRLQHYPLITHAAYVALHGT